MTALPNGHAAKPDRFAYLAGRLTDPQDRETYAALISYARALPPSDEFRQLVDLLGLLSLLGQRVPDALAELLAELRAQTAAAGECRARVDERLAQLPKEIAAGVNADGIARAMSESFRQQLTMTGLQDTAALLNRSVKEIKTLSATITSALRPAAQGYKNISETISAELSKLISASRHLQGYNAQLVGQERSNVWLWQGGVALLLFLAGGLCGIVLEMRQTTEIVSGIVTQIERIQTPPAPVIPPSKGHFKKAQSH